jgi:predicted secreted protein
MSFTTAPFVGYGQTFEINGAYLLDDIQDVTYAGSKTDAADTTSSSSSGGYRTFIPGLSEAGDCTVKLVWYPGDGSQEYVKTQVGVNNITCVHTLPNSLGTLSFSGLITGFDHSAPLDKAGEATLKVKISGSVTYAHS